MSNVTTLATTRARRVFAPGEFISPTQKHIGRISESALQARVKGITFVRDGIQAIVELSTSPDKGAIVQELIAAMNYSVADCTKELKRRKLAA